MARKIFSSTYPVCPVGNTVIVWLISDVTWITHDDDGGYCQFWFMLGQRNRGCVHNLQ